MTHVNPAVKKWPDFEAAILRPWFVLAVMSGCERVAKKHLDEVEIETFLPLVQTDRKYPPKGRIPELPYICRPWIPGYLFVQLEHEDRRWDEIAVQRERNHRILSVLTSAAGNRIQIEQSWIERTLARADKDGIIEHWVRPEDRVTRFEYGKPARVTSGPFVSYYGIVEKQRGGNVTIVTTTMRLTLRWDQVEAVE